MATPCWRSWRAGRWAPCSASGSRSRGEPAAVLGLGLPVGWRARCWSDPAGLRLRFVHVAGATRGMDVTWRIEPVPRDASPGTRVTIEHDFAPRVPGFAAFVDRAFTRPIAGRTLATFKALAEAIAADPTVHAGEPGGARHP